MNKQWLILQLRRVALTSRSIGTEAEAIITALEADWIPASVGANWAVLAGLLPPVEPPWCAQWRDAAREARIEKYGRNGILERGAA